MFWRGFNNAGVQGIISLYGNDTWISPSFEISGSCERLAVSIIGVGTLPEPYY